MKAKVIENLCIGCGACQALAPDEFELNDNGVSESLNQEVDEANVDAVYEACELCPTNAIVIDNE